MCIASCRGKSEAQKAPRINLATASLSTASIQHLKNRKLDPDYMTHPSNSILTVCVSCRGRSAAQKAPKINLATASLSTASIQHLKNRKLDPDYMTHPSNSILTVCVSCRGKSAAQKAPRINLATASLSTASIQHLKNRKLDLCTARLAEMGFKGHRDAARMMGGEPDAAFEMIMQCETPS